MIVCRNQVPMGRLTVAPGNHRGNMNPCLELDQAREISTELAHAERQRQLRKQARKGA